MCMSVISKVNSANQLKRSLKQEQNGKTVIDWELCQRLCFNHVNKWYQYKAETDRRKEREYSGSLLTRQTHMQVRRPDLIVVNKGKK